MRVQITLMSAIITLMCMEITLVHVGITLVQVEVQLSVQKSHSACGNHTLCVVQSKIIRAQKWNLLFISRVTNPSIRNFLLISKKYTLWSQEKPKILYQV
jgi:hypothetical protein